MNTNGILNEAFWVGAFSRSFKVLHAIGYPNSFLKYLLRFDFVLGSNLGAEDTSRLVKKLDSPCLHRVYITMEEHDQYFPFPFQIHSLSLILFCT